MSTEGQEPFDPMKILADIPNAPTKAHIDSWKAQVPNGIIRVFPASGKRVFFLRGITGLEMRKMQEKILPGAPNPEQEFQLLALEAACVWTNLTADHKLTAEYLRTATAGLPFTLWAIVESLSDFIPPQQLYEMTFDL